MPSAEKPKKTSRAASLAQADCCDTTIRLNYVSDGEPGIRRKKLGQHWQYFTADGKRITDDAIIERINRLAIPPAYQDVWICADPFGHIQAVGRDAKGRKQYRYHQHWRAVRDANKYDRLQSFGQALPQIRTRIDQDLSLSGLPRERVLAAVVRLLDTTLIRVGNEEYARTNQSYGLTTLQDDHVDIQGAKICFRFRGKSGVEHDIEVRDQRVAKIVKRCMDIPGQELFQYLDDEGLRHKLGSGDVNQYLNDISAKDFTAKDYRTWAGSVLAYEQLSTLAAADTVAERKRNVVAAIAQVSERLGNTPAVCKRCYIHPAVLTSYLEQRLPRDATTRERKGLSLAESRFMRFLESLEPVEQTLPAVEIVGIGVAASDWSKAKEAA